MRLCAYRVRGTSDAARHLTPMRPAATSHPDVHDQSLLISRRLIRLAVVHGRRRVYVVWQGPDIPAEGGELGEEVMLRQVHRLIPR